MAALFPGKHLAGLLTVLFPLPLCSHLQGMFFRTARMLEAGMKPV